MNIDVNKKIYDLEGNPVKENGKEINFADIAIVSLNVNFDDEKTDFKEKSARFVLMTKLYNAKESGKPLELSVEDASLLKKLIAKIWTPLIVGRCGEIIEQQSKNE